MLFPEKSETQISKLKTSTNVKNSKRYDLEERTLRFARDVRLLAKKIPRAVSLFEDMKQLVRSSGSVGANYREANEAVSKKDFLLRIKICRKEAKESQYWLQLISFSVTERLVTDCRALEQEAKELTMIFGAILQKSL